jgi:hypothetical protein
MSLWMLSVPVWGGMVSRFFQTGRCAFIKGKINKRCAFLGKNQIPVAKTSPRRPSHAWQIFFSVHRGGRIIR